MLKRIFSLILSGVLLLQVSCFYAAAESSSINEDTERMSNTFKNYESDFCSAYPKNRCGNTVDVNCARRRMYKGIRESDVLETRFKDEKVGSDCETDLHFWKYDGLSKLAEIFNGYITENNKQENKHRFISEFIGKTKELFNTNDKDSAEIMKRVIKNFKYKKSLELTEEDILKWINEMEKTKENILSDKSSILAGGAVGSVVGTAIGWGIHGYFVAKAAAFAAAMHTLVAPVLAVGGTKAATAFAVATAAPAAAPFLAAGAAVAGIAGLYIGNHYGKEKNIAKAAGDELDEARKHEIKLNVYSYAIENIFNSIQRKEYVDNDLLSAELNFDKYSPSAFIDYVNLNLRPSKKDVNKVFENLSNSLSKLIDKFNLNKEAL